MSLQLIDVEKRYGRRAVLREASIVVGRGEFVGLLGPNGSGKTTTLRIASGFLAPTRGEVLVDGEVLTAESRDLRAKVGYLPERPPLYDPLEVGDYLRFVAEAKAVPNRDRALSTVIEACFLGEVRGQRIGRLSKGFRQRVGLAQALLGDPKLLLLDEATGGLDPVQIREARVAITRGAEGRATLFSTHIMQEASALCSRLVLLREGRVVAEHDLASRPATRVWRLEAAGLDFDRAAGILRAIPGPGRIRQAESADGVLSLVFEIRADAASDPRGEIAAQFSRAGQLLELSPVPDSLEDLLIRSFESRVPAD